MIWDGPTCMSGIGRLSAGAMGMCPVTEQASPGLFTWGAGQGSKKENRNT